MTVTVTLSLKWPFRPRDGAYAMHEAIRDWECARPSVSVFGQMASPTEKQVSVCIIHFLL